MKILKRNQIIILVVALMLVSVGYLNYTNSNMNNETKQTSTTNIVEKDEVAGIGDARLVDSSNVEGANVNAQIAMVPNENNEETASSSAVATSNTETTSNVTVGNETLETSSKEAEEYFTESKLNRETMYSQMIESYQKILESEKISETQKSIAQTEIKNINETKNKIMICENLIKTKGIEDLVIFVNDQSFSVVVRADTLGQEQIAQIQNIIAREMNCEISNIHISTK